jgi:hypothetical protein
MWLLQKPRTSVFLVLLIIAVDKNKELTIGHQHRLDILFFSQIIYGVRPFEVTANSSFCPLKAAPPYVLLA